jgi:hypothetical protein
MPQKRAPRLIGRGLSPNIGANVTIGGLSPIKTRHFIQATLFILLSTIFCVYYIAFPLANLKFVHGYPRFGTPPAPNEFKSSRYTWGWVFIYILTALNLLLPYLLALALTNNTTPEYAKLHYYASRITITLSLIGFIGLSIIWLFFCNTSFAGYTFCHDRRWCCVHYASSLEASKWCPNNTPCVPNVSSSSQLSRRDEFFQVWLFALLWSFWAMAHKAVNQDLAGYGLFQEAFEEYAIGDEGDEEEEYSLNKDL